MSPVLARPILVIEDSPQEAELIKAALERGGLNHPVTLLANAEEVIAYFEGRAPYAPRQDFPLPSLLFLDLTLPGRSGFDVLEWIRKDAKRRTLPVVVFTSSRRPDDMERAYSVGASSFLVKPVKFEELIEVLVHTATYWLKYNLSRDL